MPSEHRSRIGAALLGGATVFVVGGATTVATKAAGWDNPIVIGLLFVGALFFFGAVWAWTHIPGHPADRMDRARAHYKKGKAIQAWTPPLVPASLEESQHGQCQKAELVDNWAEATWIMLSRDFPSREDEFCQKNGYAYIREAVTAERKVTGTDRYLKEKLEVIARLLKEYER
jgi:hypothetical protein